MKKGRSLENGNMNQIYSSKNKSYHESGGIFTESGGFFVEGQRMQGKEPEMCQNPCGKGETFADVFGTPGRQSSTVWL